MEAWIREIIYKIKCLSDEQRQLVLIFVRTVIRDFILAWAIRGGVGFLPHLLKLFRLYEYC